MTRRSAASSSVAVTSKENGMRWQPHGLNSDLRFCLGPDVFMAWLTSNCHSTDEGLCPKRLVFSKNLTIIYIYFYILPSATQPQKSLVSFYVAPCDKSFLGGEIMAAGRVFVKEVFDNGAALDKHTTCFLLVDFRINKPLKFLNL